MTTSETESVGAASEPWRDRKRYMWLFGLVAPTALGQAAALVWVFDQLGWGRVAPMWWWIGPLLVYVLLPSLDRFFGPDGQNPP
ncbi:alkane 1-monooxygenase, partial [Nocardia sp. NPDC003345]